MKEEINLTINMAFLESVKLFNQNGAWVIEHTMNSGKVITQYYASDLKRAKDDYNQTIDAIPVRLCNNKI